MPPPREQLIDEILDVLRGERDRASRPGEQLATVDQAAALLAAVPRVNDGDVITAADHNAVRAVLEYLLGRGSGGNAATPLLSVAPALLPSAEQAPWRIEVGAAYAPEEPTYAGWMPLELPHGALIDAVSVSGAMPDPSQGVWSAQFGRSEAGARKSAVLFSASLADGTSPSGDFERSLDFVAAGTPAQTVQRRRVDRTRYDYWFFSAVTKPLSAGDREVQLRQVQVGLTYDT